MTRQEIINIIAQYGIQVIGNRENGKVGASKPTAELKHIINEHRQEIINIYFDEQERKEEERKARVEARRIERMTKLYSNPEQKIRIIKKYDGKIIVENGADDILGIESIDLEGLKQYAKDYEDGNTYYQLTVAELEELAIEKEEVKEIDKTELGKEIEKNAEIAKETGKPQKIEENLSWDPAKGIPVKDCKMVNPKGELYLYTKELEK